MKDMMNELPGLDRVRARFVEMLSDRQERIAMHAVQAWDGETVEAINGNLDDAQMILHQVAGTAGSLGFEDLGQMARSCEEAILAHLKGPDSDLAICPGDLIVRLDEFVAQCRAVLEASAPANA